MTTDNAVMVAHYDWRLVALSVLISILAAYASRALAERVTNAARRRAWFAWLIGGAMADGIGTWSMHYTGMLALSLPVLVQYDLPTVGLSLLIAVIGSGAALLVWSRPQLGWRGVLLASILLGGLGISGLHFSAMTAMRYQGMEHYSPILTMISVGLAIVFSLMSLVVAYVVRESALGRRQRYHTSVLLRGVASPVMHYTAMAAATFIYFAVVPDVSHAVSIVPLGFLGISIVPVMVLVVALLTTLLDRLQKQEEKYRTVFETALDVMMLLDQQGNIFDINHRAEALTGYSQAELRDKNVFQHLIVDEDQPVIRQMLLDIAQGLYREYEVRWRAKDGHIVYLAGASAARFSPSGEFLSSVCALHDISKWKQAEAELRQYTKRLETQHEIEEAILAARSLTEIAAGVLHHVTDLMPCQMVGIVLLDFDARESILFAVQVTGVSQFVSGQRFPLQDSWAGINSLRAKLEQGQVLIIDDVAPLPESPLGQILLAEGRRSWLSAPLRIQDTLVGTLNLWADQPGRFTADDTDIIRQVADSLAIAITQVRLFADVSDARDRLQMLSRQLVEAQEAERRRLAQELHDQVGQNLAALGLNLGALRSQLPARTTRKIEVLLEDSSRLLDETVQLVRDKMAELRPAILDDYGLEAAIRWFVEQFSKRIGLTVTVQAREVTPRLPPEVETALFRITQEALMNVAKHSHAQHVTVTLESLETAIHLTIADDGEGFDQNKLHQRTDRRGFGLLSMQERAASVGGRFRVQSAPGQGTQIVVEVLR